MMSNRRSTLGALILLSWAMLVSPHLDEESFKSSMEKTLDFVNIFKNKEGNEAGLSLGVMNEEKLAAREDRVEGNKAAEKDDKAENGAAKGIKGLDPMPTVPNPGDQGPQPVPVVQVPQPTPGVLQEGFYKQSCPEAENIVKRVLDENFQKDPTLAPSIVRLFFHDCFVTGCDASLLLDRTPTRDAVEKRAVQNGIFVRGFNVIDEIKAALEAQCPGIVSCADTLAFANRDSLVFSGVPPYPVAAGRRDSLVSLATIAEKSLPVPESSAPQMIELFKGRGFSIEEMVVLSGAHSIGAAHCTVVAGRFRNPQMWADMDPGYVMKMQVMTACDNVTQDLAFDPYSQHKMDSRYYKELLNKRALLESDHNLSKDPQANAVMKKYVGDQVGWLTSFTNSITKLGTLGVLTGNKGEIRKQCRASN